MLTGIPHLLTGLYSEEPARESSNVVHENILLKKNMLIEKMFCHHSGSSNYMTLPVLSIPLLYLF